MRNSLLKICLQLGTAHRLLHKTERCAAPVSKTALSSLRKKTGYSFVNCKKALEQFGEDINQAEIWLKEQAQKEGWAKATKLQDRSAVQGLVGVNYNPDEGTGILVEVNCETDFVARNSKFQDMVARVSESCLRELELKPINGSSYHKWSVSADVLLGFKSPQGKTLGDLLALTIGQMGENMVLRRAVLVKANPNECRISGYAHAADTVPPSQGCSFGKYGALLMYRKTPNTITDSDESKIPSNLSLDDVGRQLCQHIVGMNPQSIGSLDDEESSKNMEDESRLVHQEFLADPAVDVSDVLIQNNVEVLDFVRFECGGKISEQS